MAAIAVAVLISLTVACGSASGQTATPTQSVEVADQSPPTPQPVIETTEGGFSVTIHMSAPSGMFQVGQAVVKSVGDRTMITVDVEPPGDSAQPIHIHAGTCADVGVVLHTLNNVVRGHSETPIDAPIKDIVSADRLINVHRSYQDFPTYTACGEFPDLP